jgi:hypothetical protein
VWILSSKILYTVVFNLSFCDLGRILFLNHRLGLFSSLFSPLILLLLLSLILWVEVVFLILLSIGGSRMRIFSFKPRTGSWGVILGQNASVGSFSTCGDPDPAPACAVFTLGVRTVVVLSDTLGGGVFSSLFGASVLRLDNISVKKASIAAFNLLPVLRNGVAAAGFFNASVSSSKAVDALSADAVVGMLYFSGRNTTVSETLVPLVFGI